MSAPMKVDEFLKAQSSGFTATLEPIPENPTDVKVTPYRDDRGCGCSSSFRLPKNMIRAIIPTGKFHFCCGKRLEVAVVEFAEDASVSVADLMKRVEQTSAHAHPSPQQAPGANPVSQQASVNRGGLSGGIVGRWPIPGIPCEVECIEVCTRFCGPTGWACCQWETRCGLNCFGIA